MGKVVKAVAIIAVAVAVAYFAPQLLPTFIGTGATATAVTAAVVSMAISVAVTTGFALLAGKPHTSTAPGAPPPTRGQPMEERGFKWEYPPAPPAGTMPPVGEHWLRDNIFWPWQTFAVRRIKGTCLRPIIPNGHNWVVIDRHAAIATGDFLLIKPNDLRAYMRASGGGRASGLVKRFLGVDPERQVAVFETTNPYNRVETGLSRIVHAYRVVSVHRSWWQALWVAMSNARAGQSSTSSA